MDVLMKRIATSVTFHCSISSSLTIQVLIIVLLSIYQSILPAMLRSFYFIF